MRSVYRYRSCRIHKHGDIPTPNHPSLWSLSDHEALWVLPRRAASRERAKRGALSGLRCGRTADRDVLMLEHRGIEDARRQTPRLR